MAKAEFICCSSGGGKDSAIKLSSIPKTGVQKRIAKKPGNRSELGLGCRWDTKTSRMGEFGDFLFILFCFDKLTEQYSFRRQARIYIQGRVWIFNTISRCLYWGWESLSKLRGTLAKTEVCRSSKKQKTEVKWRPMGKQAQGDNINNAAKINFKLNLPSFCK